MVNSRIPIAATSIVQGVHSFSGFQLGHGVGDPLLQVIVEPGLYTMRKPDGFSFEQRGGRGPQGAFEFSSRSHQVTTTSEHAAMASSVKLQVAVELRDGELFPFGKLLIDLLHDRLYLFLVPGVVLIDVSKSYTYVGIPKHLNRCPCSPGEEHFGDSSQALRRAPLIYLPRPS